ncbi:MAG TPA: VCBS repeat-containing protein [Candidatus Manganitrophaceae bacterium]|nr:VCBS repeat-containing protein [Candidatus Manganitrophaceae bacterium]
MKLKIFLFILSGFLFLGCGRKGSDEPVQVAVKPTFFQLPAGGQVQFSADVSGTLDKTVQWSVTGAGSSISTTGLYQAPLAPSTATIQAKSVADPTAVGNGAAQTTQVQKLTGEVLLPDMSQLVIGGYTVRAGITIDLNGDNILDLVAFSESTNTVRFFLGLGTAGKFNHKDISITAPVAVAVADFIPEGSNAFAADAAVACAGPCEPNQPNIALIQGGAFTNYTITYSSNTPGSPGPGLDLSDLGPAALLAAGRFHGDVEARNSDLVAVTADGKLVLFLQNKQVVPVAFDRTAPIQVGTPVQLVVADFNQDSFLDLAVVRGGVSDVLILLGDGTGNFPSQVSVPMPAQPISIGVGDFNGDDIPDLAAAFSSLKSVSYSIGKGDGTFQPPTSIALSSRPEKLVVEDINLDRVVKTDRLKGNAMQDIAVSLPDEKEVYALFTDGTGSMIGSWFYKTDVAPASLLSGFFSGPNSPSGFQSVGLVYINRSENRFYILNNANF